VGAPRHVGAEDPGQPRQVSTTRVTDVASAVARPPPPDWAAGQQKTPTGDLR